jgi:hypothetical protein
VAVADYNQDGRLDVAISQNNDETKLFQNRKAPEGLRLRFHGSGKNRDAIGARYQIIESDRVSPLRELQAGGGWLSQDSLVQVVKSPGEAARLRVRWPDGNTNEFPLPRAARELVVGADGVKVVK